MRSDYCRDFVILIDSTPSDSLKSNLELFKESTNNRALVKAHLQKLNISNVYVVDNLDKMLEISIDLYKAQESIWKYRSFSLGK